MTLEELLALLPHLTAEQREMIIDAYLFAEEAHRPQRRRSGEPYFVHVSAVAGIIADLGMDVPTIIAGLLHDVVEDTPITPATIRARYGEEIMQLVEGVTKLDRLTPEGSPHELTEAQYLQKTIVAMGDDVRVIIIKLADRLHNMRTLASLKPQRQVEISRETLDLFAPLASRLGIWTIKSDLETLCFQYVDPLAYANLKQQAATSDEQLAPFFERLTTQLHAELAKNNITAIIKRHPRNLYTIYQEMQQKQITFAETFGVRSIRILVENTSQCYQTLGIVHQIWKPIPGQVQDYIATPKDNFYQSLHTAVYREDGGSLKVQIRTHAMEDQALYGIASYWRQRNGALQEKLAQRLAYLKDLIEPAEVEATPEQFVKSVIENIHSNRIYARTPRGDIIDLPRRATPIDFAYYVHTEVGHRCRGARINGKLMPLDYQLQNDDEVEIYTTHRGGGPLLEWLDERLGFVYTNRAKGKIRAWFKAQEQTTLIHKGQQALDEKMDQFGLPPADYEALRYYTPYNTVDEMLVAIGTGAVTASDIVTQALDRANLHPAYRGEAASLPITGARGYKVKLARCCRPKYGEPVVGYITREAKVSIHHANCPVLNQSHNIADRLIPVNWGPRLQTQVFAVPIELQTLDRPGIMGDIGTAVAKENINMSEVNILTQNGQATFKLTVEVDSFASLSRLLAKIQSLEGVLEARRLVAV